MKLIVAIRAKNTQAARQLLAECPCAILKSRLESQDPALRNLVEGCYARGLLCEREGLGVHWLLVESELAVSSWRERAGVEVCFTEPWLRQQALAIRYLKGVAYCDAAAAWAEFVPWSGREPTAIQQGDGVDWAGLPLTPLPAPSPQPVAITPDQQDAAPATPKQRGWSKRKPSDRAAMNQQPRARRSNRSNTRAQGLVVEASGELPFGSETPAPDARKAAVKPGAKKRRKPVDEEQLDLFV